jgi:hypothetical protein
MWTQLDARKKIDAIPLRRQKAVAPMMTSAMMAKSAQESSRLRFWCDGYVCESAP